VRDPGVHPRDDQRHVGRKGRVRGARPHDPELYKDVTALKPAATNEKPDSPGPSDTDNTSQTLVSLREEKVLRTGDEQRKNVEGGSAHTIPHT
jgi:hypothetical protein